MDLVITKYTTNRIAIFINDGDANFDPRPEISVGINPHLVVAGDLDGNGTIDLAVTNDDAGLEMDPRTATAICCGVRFDTGDLSLHATPLDVEAFHESFRRADRKMLARINRPMLPPSYYSELQRSLNRARRHGPLVFGLLGRVRNPESVAEMADFFRRMEGCRWSLVGGAFEDNYHLSLRTDLAYGDAYPLMEAIVADEGSFGGRGPVAGGQIACDGRDVDALQGLERRLRARALALVDPSELRPADPPEGTRLTRIA